ARGRVPLLHGHRDRDPRGRQLLPAQGKAEPGVEAELRNRLRARLISPRLRNLLANTSRALGSAVFTCAALFGGGELLMQKKYGAVPPGPPENAWARYDATRGWAMNPGHYSFFDVRAARRVDV